MLWITWFELVCELRFAFSRLRTFQWFVISLAGMTIRRDCSGVTSFIRAIGISPNFYTRILNNFHSNGINLSELTIYWTKLVLKIFEKNLVRLNDKILLAGDGIKVGKEGKKMPGVKLLHQSSQSNSKAEFIMGHHFQSITLLVTSGLSYLAVPLISRIHEGIKSSPNEKKTLLDKFFDLFENLEIKTAYLVADAYYCCGPLAKALLKKGIYLITRVRNNAVAYLPYAGIKNKRGRPKKYGDKIKLVNLFNNIENFKTMSSSVYGEENIKIKYLIVDLYWKQFGELVRYCLVDHPTRGKCIFMTPDLTLSANDIVKGYGLRFKIEYSFKELVHNLGGFCYRFWLMSMDKIKRKSGDTYTHRMEREKKEKFYQKLNVYNLHVQMSLIAQGLLQYFSITYSEQIWNSFGTWLRTIRPGLVPSVQVCQESFRNCLSDFYNVFEYKGKWRKFIQKITENSISPPISSRRA